MTDIVSRPTRSRMMSNIKGRDTAPELIIRSNLHKLGFRYRLHDKTLPAKPDLVLPKYNAVILINGCFWHMHNCHLFKWPSTRAEFWKKKIESNAKRDERNLRELLTQNWRVGIVWECSLKGKYRQNEVDVVNKMKLWLTSEMPYLEIMCKPEGLA